MKGKKLMLALAVATLMTLPLVSAFAAGPSDSNPTVKVTDASFRCGETGTSQILVSIANDPGVHGVEVHLSFNDAKLQVMDADDSLAGVQIAAEGGLFPLDEQVVVQEVNNATGTILFAVSRKDGDSVQNATDAAIATITWQAAVDCNTVEQEECSPVSVVDALMSDADGYAITVDIEPPGSVCYDGQGLGCITGSVQLQGRYPDRTPYHSGATVTAEKDGVVVASATTDDSGNFTLDNLAPEDTYEVSASMYPYLDSANGSVVAGEVCTDLGATKLLGGDVAPQDPEPDNAIDISDIAYIAFRFRGADLSADVNGDSVVNILDLTMSAANFLRTGPTPWSMTP
ncbi:MAG: hypothetical protein E3J21_26435 [Anaerolineales bacterium]|nr:MAG: hypothetical protein E3J21_26435 [Anaerolineales bacterium]